MTTHPLKLNRFERGVLGTLADTARYATEARRDSMKERAISNARYFILGATGLDCEDDKEIERVLVAIWNDQPVDNINI